MVSHYGYRGKQWSTVQLTYFELYDSNNRAIKLMDSESVFSCISTPGGTRILKICMPNQISGQKVPTYVMFSCQFHKSEVISLVRKTSSFLWCTHWNCTFSQT